MFLNCVPKPAFRYTSVSGFWERICSPTVEWSQAGRLPKSVSLYVPLRKRTRRGMALAQAFAREFDAVGVVNDTVEDGVGERGKISPRRLDLEWRRLVWRLFGIGCFLDGGVFVHRFKTPGQAALARSSTRRTTLLE